MRGIREGGKRGIKMGFERGLELYNRERAAVHLEVDVSSIA